jgi:hypothetical protein
VGSTIGGSAGSSKPKILEYGEERNIDKGPEKETWRTKLLSSSYNLEDFLFNFSRKGSIEFVSNDEK